MVGSPEPPKPWARRVSRLPLDVQMSGHSVGRKSRRAHGSVLAPDLYGPDLSRSVEVASTYDCRGTEPFVFEPIMGEAMYTARLKSGANQHFEDGEPWARRDLRPTGCPVV